jgi:hypothetical protein
MLMSHQILKAHPRTAADLKNLTAARQKVVEATKVVIPNYFSPIKVMGGAFRIEDCDIVKRTTERLSDYAQFIRVPHLVTMIENELFAASVIEINNGKGLSIDIFTKPVILDKLIEPRPIFMHAHVTIEDLAEVEFEWDGDDYFITLTNAIFQPDTRYSHSTELYKGGGAGYDWTEDDELYERQVNLVYTESLSDQLYSEAHSVVVPLTVVILNVLIFLNVRNTVVKKYQFSKNAAVKLGIPPVFAKPSEYHVLDIFRDLHDVPNFSQVIQFVRSETDRGECMQSQRRAHMVSGHFKKRTTGLFWWSPFIRCKESSAMIEKDYQLKVS